MKTSFAQRALALLKEEVEHAGGVREFSREHGVQASKISRWLTGSTSPKLDDLGEIFDTFGIDVCHGTGCDGGRPVLFDPPNGVLGRDLETLTDSEFIAVPVVRDPLLLTSYAVPEENRSGWTLIHRNFQSVKGRHDLVVISVSDDTMAPTLNAGDLVLVDRDRAPVVHGKIYLVRDPQGDTGFRRVVTRELPDGDVQIIYGNDARRNMRPRVYSLRRDFGGDMNRAVLGRAVWLRSDIAEK